MDLNALIDPGHWEFWVAVGTVLAILEVIDGSFFLLSLGIGALFTAIPVAAGVNDTSLIFGICAVIEIAVLLLLRPFLGRHFRVDETPSNVDALIGQEAVVTEPIDGIISTGYVRVASEEWRATTHADIQIKAGTTVIVSALSGATLTVQLPAETDGTALKQEED